MDQQIKGIVIEKNGDGIFEKIKSLPLAFFPDEAVKVKIHYSSLNYKDALALTNKAPIIKHFPLIPGIDFAGEVIASRDAKFKKGDLVIANGFGLGEKYMGGLTTFNSVRSEYLIHLPKGLLPQQAMMIGTAGYTAMLAVMSLKKYGITPDKGSILVTGANGGVGSFAIRFLSSMGFDVVAATRNSENTAYLQQLGAKEIIDAAMLFEKNKPLQKVEWAGAIDSLGSDCLVNICAKLHYGGAVAACGLAMGMDFKATVAPFILRGIGLLGIDSVMRSYEDRVTAWSMIEKIIRPEDLALICEEITLEDVIDKAHQLIAGKIRGRLYVNLLDVSDNT